ncbi:nitroreductase family protein [Vibrio hibernica]|uniref:nitroreductase family protein n=1 Tax=Vibrio hibernica TaxID=2587465 RepID=UPI0039B0E820
MTHPIIKDLTSRHTAKRYDSSKKVSAEDMQIVKDAIRLSPSSINSQPWKFVVLESDQAKQRFHNTFANKFQFNQPHATAASHIILFAHKMQYIRADYEKVVDQGIIDGRTKAEDKQQAFGGFVFVDLNTNEQGFNNDWTKSQTYLALGNALHTLARLGIDSTTMEGVDSEMIGQEFAAELDGYECHVALAIGYHDSSEDYNAKLPKSRLAEQEVMITL